MFSRLAIVNRGEPAMRAIHAVRELNDRRDDPIRAIALYTTGQRGAMFVRHADEAVAIGSSYLDYAALERALVESRADAAWVGWGFVAEHPEFVELCERLGVVFVGPDAAAMRRVGDKIGSKLLAEEAGVPVAAWSRGPVETVERAAQVAAEIGYPVMIKATAGGGGRGIRRVDAAADLPAAFRSARAEARNAVGDPTVLIEKVLFPTRHVEVQVIADGQGAAWAVGVRDCSYQRRNQKVVEETPSPALTAAEDENLRAAAARLMLRAGYRGAGTVEFLFDPVERALSFMEVNARLQVEHPITEAVTGLDLVKLQLHVAGGGRLEGEPPPAMGHAIEARLNAEDPALGFAPAPGRIDLLRLPTGPGVRVDTGVAEGDTIPAEFDSMIAKLIAWGRDRDEALARLRRALSDTTVVVDGGTTNQGFLLEMLERNEVRRGEVDTTWLDRLNLQGDIVPVRHADVALVQAAIELIDEELAVDRAQFYAFARRGRPRASDATERLVELRHRGQSYRCLVSQIGPRHYRVRVGGAVVEASVEPVGTHERRIELDARVHRTLISRQGADLLVEVDSVPHRVSRDDGGIVRNLSPAVVVSIPVAVGDEVEAGDVVAVVESMKMENSLTAPFRGRVREVVATPNVHVDAQAPLLRLEPIGDSAGDEAGERLDFAALAMAERDEQPPRCLADLRQLEWLVMGYDVERADVMRIVADLHGACSDLACDPALVPGEHRLLRLFADLRVLSRPRHDITDHVASRSPEQYLYAFLRSLDAEAEGLPEHFARELESALAHYGVEELERTPALEEACYRLYLSQQRAALARDAVLAILDRRLERAGDLVGAVGDDFRDALDRLVVASEGRDPVVADLAREVRYEYYDRPLIDSAREAVYDAMQVHLDALADDPQLHMAPLVDCPRPLAPLLTRRMSDASPDVRRLLLETMARRYYRMRPPDGFERAGDGLLVARYESEDGPRRLATAFIELGDVAPVARLLAALPAGDPIAVDLYAEYRGPAPPHAELSTRLAAELNAAGLPESVSRVVVAAAEPGAGPGMAAVDIFTFLPGASGFEEQELLRGLHPMMGERLHLWRLSKFELERLPAAEDVYLFRGVAHDDPRDERLFAIAEVRDLTPLRDDEGRVTSLPELQDMLTEALEAIRGFQAHRPPTKRLQWNRVVLHAWPVLQLTPEEVSEVLVRLAPAMSGLGIEILLVRVPMRVDGEVRNRLLRLFTPTGHSAVVEIDDPPTRPLMPLDEGARRIVSARRRGTRHPAEIVKMLAPAHSGDGAVPGQPRGDFEELDLTDDGTLAAVTRPAATNPSGIVVALIRNYTARYPEGMERVLLGGDPTRALGSLAEPECRRIIAALDLAERRGLPVEWFALSAGAKIAMDSGTENMDWIAAVLRRIIEFTQAGGELNVVVTGINVGAQPYWNAEATMLMHTRGILVMTPDSAMVLTGKQALDYSGGVSAEDNFGIGGYERIMGPNGQAQYWAPDLAGACGVLLAHYEQTYVAPGERFPRRAATSDPLDRDVGSAPHSAPGSPLRHVGEIFSDGSNPGRKLPFDIRSIMRAVTDADSAPLERWAGMRDAENAVVWDANLGGRPVALVGIESHPLRRYGELPADGPEHWTAGTLFPRSSKKIARAVNAASGRRPLVVLANLAGFDGSPESMRELQLEFGAEIGRAVTNFRGPIVFCVVSRYHGGAFVVFSQRLNADLEAYAVEGAHASVIGGAPAAAVVFAREVDQAARSDPRIVALDEQIERADGGERQRLRAERSALWSDVRNEKMGELAAEFDSVHSVERAVRMGSVTGIVAPERLRPFLIEAVERGIRRTLEREDSADGRTGMAHKVAG